MSKRAPKWTGFSGLLDHTHRHMLTLPCHTRYHTGDIYLARFQLDLLSDSGAPSPTAAVAYSPAPAAAGSGSSGAAASGTVLLAPEDSWDGPSKGAGGGGGGQGGQGVAADGGEARQRRQKKQRVDSDFIY